MPRSLGKCGEDSAMSVEVVDIAVGGGMSLRAVSI